MCVKGNFDILLFLATRYLWDKNRSALGVVHKIISPPFYTW